MRPPILAPELIDTIISNVHASDSGCVLRNLHWFAVSGYIRAAVSLGFGGSVCFPHVIRRPTCVPYSKRLYRILQKFYYLEYIKFEVHEGERTPEQDWASTDETLPLLLRMLVKLG